MSASPPIDGAPGAGVVEPPDDDVLAGEFVLGVLSTDEHAMVRERRTRDRALAAKIEQWEGRLAPWLEEYAPVSAPAQLWSRVCDRLGWSRTTPRAGLWQSLALWRSVAALAVLVAGALVWLRAEHPPLAPVVRNEEPGLTKPVSTLADDQGRTAWLASVDRTRGTVLMVPVPHAADANGRVAELWIIAAGHAPRSLGAVSVDRAHTVGVPEDARWALTAPGSVLAITLEPSPGVPHAAPSGPIIAKGTVQS